MSTPLLSIIIPVYNVELYLDECLRSVVAQTLRDIEIILVDDGSPDRCGEMCDAWAKKDARIRVIHQKNMGADPTRNTGLAIAQGEFIGFVDPDDVISPHMFEYLYQNIQQYEADVSVCSYLRVPQEATSEQIQQRLQDATVQEEKCVSVWDAEDELGDPLLSNYMVVGYTLWLQLFRRSSVPFGNTWFDPKVRSGGDTLFILQYTTDCRRVVYSSCPLYAYRMVTNSDSNKCDPDRVRTRIYIVEQWVQHVRRAGKLKLIEKYELDFYRQCLGKIRSYYKTFKLTWYYQVQIRKEKEFRQKIYEGMKRGYVLPVAYWITFCSPLCFSVLFFRLAPISVLCRCRRLIKRGLLALNPSVWVRWWRNKK